MKVQGLKSGYHIGFAEEFFTLWYVSPPDELGVQDAYYNGRISKSKEETIKKYPDYPFADLRGAKWSFVSSQRIEYDIDQFAFGKYVGKSFSEVVDLEYQKWYYGQTQNPELLKIMINAGIFEFKGRLFATKKELDEYKEYDGLVKKLFDGEIEVELISNITERRSILVSVGNDLFKDEFPWGFSLEWGESLPPINERHYQGFTYYVMSGKRSMKGLRAKIVTQKGMIKELELI